MISFARQADPFSRDLRARVYEHLGERRQRFGGESMACKALFWMLCTGVFYGGVLLQALPLPLRFVSGVLAAYSLFFLVLNICHDAVHGCLWRSSRMNALTHAFFFNLLGLDSRLWSLRHLRSHHLFPNVPGCDSDIDETAIIRLSPHSPWRRIYRIQHLYAPLIYAILPLHSVFYQDVAYLFRTQIANVKDIRHGPKEIFQFVALKILYFSFWILIPWLAADLSLLQVGLGYLGVNGLLGFAFIPIAATHLNAFSAHPMPEEGRIPTSHARFQLASSLDWAPLSPVATFFYGGLNSHAAHHLFPRISHRHYHWITRMILEEARKHGIPYHTTTFLGAIVSHFRYLKLLGSRAEVDLSLQAKGAL